MPSKSGNVPTWDAKINRTYPLPEKFMCAVGGEWKPNSHFSKKQLAVWYRKKRSPNDGITAANIQIVCRDHSGEPAILLKCTGPCGQWKARDKFSTSQRRNKLRWCAGCIRWRLQQDYDSIPIAAPNEANEAVDEREGFAAVEEAIPFEPEDDLEHGEEDASFPGIADDVSIGTDKEDEGGPCPSVSGHGHFFDEDSDSDEEEILAANISSALSLSKPRSTMAIGTSQSKNGQPAKSNFQPTHTTSNWIPPHLRKHENLITLKVKNLTESHIPGHAGPIPSTSMTNDTILPHLRAAAPQHAASLTQPRGANNSLSSDPGDSVMPASSISNNPEPLKQSLATSPYSFAPGASTQSVVSDNSRAGVPTLSSNSRTYSNAGKERRNSRVSQSRQFNAFDPQGNAHRRTVEGNDTRTSLSPSRPTQSIADCKKPTSGSWARPDRRRIFGTVSLENKRSGKDHVHVYDSGSEDEM